jgi:hypothetical protein
METKSNYAIKADAFAACVLPSLLSAAHRKR